MPLSRGPGPGVRDGLFDVAITRLGDALALLAACARAAVAWHGRRAADFEALLGLAGLAAALAPAPGS